MKLSEIKKLLKIASELKVKRLKVGDFEAELGETIHPTFADVGLGGPVNLAKEELYPTEEDMLYASSGYDPREDKKPQHQ